MKLSRKLAIAFSALLLSFSLIFLILDNLFIETFFIRRSITKLHEAYREVSEYIDSEDVYNKNTILREISDIAIETNTTIHFFDVDGLNIDDRPNLKFREISDIKLIIRDSKGKQIELSTKEDIDKFVSSLGSDVWFNQQNEKEHNRNIAVIGKLQKNNETCGYLVVYTPYVAVRSNTGIFNAFILYMTLVLLVISLIVSLFLSNRLTKPLIEAKEKARKMANLDFSTKLEVNSKDEIGELAISINKMSDELEKSIDSLKEANLKLENDIKLKERINKLREEFISDVSHELKTPISIIGGYSEALKLEGLSQDDINDYADIIIDESKRMNKLVRDLIKFTQIESGFMSLDKEEFLISDLINQAIKPNDLKLKEKNIKLILDIDEYDVLGDYDMMDTVFNNFFTNAINYVNDKGTIKITGKLNGNKYRVSVYNSGSNIDNENINRIWDSFYKADKARSRKYGGSGLGLAIVKSIMNTYNNKYGVESTDDGVVFYFELDTIENEEENYEQ